MRIPLQPRYRIAISSAFALLALAAVATLLAALALFLANTPWGRQAIENATARLSDGAVIVVGLAGNFPEDLRAARVELRDNQGTWLVADDVQVRWSPAQLLHNAVRLDLVQAARVQFARTPVARAARPDRASIGLPRIDVERIGLARVELGETLAGAPATVSIQGRLGIDWPRESALELRVLRIEAPGSYTMKGWITASALQADLVVDEPAHGPLSGLAGLGDLGAVSAQLHLQGAREAPALQATLAAGPLRATAAGSLDWNAQTLNLDVTGSAPAMTPRENLHWQSIALQAHVHGAFRSPDVMAQLRVEGLSAGGAQARSLHADVQGKVGQIDVHAVADGLRIPGPAPALLQGAPLEIRANVHLADPTWPTTFSLAHPLVSVKGRAHAAAGIQAEFTVTLPQLAPFSPLAGSDLRGSTALTAVVAQKGRGANIDVTGTVDMTGGSALARGLVGRGAKLDAALVVHVHEIEITRARLDAQNLQASVTGTRTAGKLDLHWHANIAQLAALSPDITGNVELDGHLEQTAEADRQGTGNDLRIAADAKGNLGTRGFANRPLEASLRLWGLPRAPVGNVTVRATVDGAPLTLAATFEHKPDGKMAIRLDRANWKSAHAQGDMALAYGAALPQGHLELQVARLADLAPWIDPSFQGSAGASVELSSVTNGKARATILADLHDPALAGRHADHMRVTGTIDDPWEQPALAVEVSLEGFAANGFEGSAGLRVKGPLHALHLDLVTDLRAPDNLPAHLVASAVLDAKARQLGVATLQAHYRKTTLELLGPAHISFLDGIVADPFRVRVAGMVVGLAGRIEPTLDVTASVRNDAVAGKGATGAAAGSKGGPAIDVRLSGSLAHAALIDAKVSLGSQVQMIATGQLPFSADEPIDLHAKGTIDAASANSFLAVSGRRLRGQLALNMDLGGTMRTPKIIGTIRIAGGNYDDDNLGLHLTGIDALASGSGDTLQIGRFTAQAGPGNVSVSGTIGVLASTLPIDLQVTARNAQPLASDFVVANVDADVHVHGAAASRVDVTGAIKVNRAEVNIPSALPPSVAVLDVRRPNKAPAPPATASATLVGLELKVDAPSAVFVRGRGIDAEMGGALAIDGTTAAPRISGGFELRRGTFALAGSTLTFTSGRVGFNGTGLDRKIDPTIDFEAQSQSTSFTAKLNVTGYAQAPKISLSSTPEMPQDEILAQLLFGTSVSKLTALQMVQIGSAVVTIGGVGSAGGGFLSTVQKSLGLDRLTVGNTPTGATSVEAGRYISKRVFVGARQMGTAGGTTQAIVQIDLTRQLKAVGAFGNGGTVQGATPDNDPGNSIGILYQVEY
jgi:translocation and assembly module TamB